MLRDKLCNHAIYLFLQKHTADLYRSVYELALNEAHYAERAFNFERGFTTIAATGTICTKASLPEKDCNSI